MITQINSYCEANNSVPTLLTSRNSYFNHILTLWMCTTLNERLRSQEDRNLIRESLARNNQWRSDIAIEYFSSQPLPSSGVRFKTGVLDHLQPCWFLEQRLSLTDILDWVTITISTITTESLFKITFNNLVKDCVL